MDGIGTLSPVDIREVWADEARDFSPWLAENVDLLGEALGMDLLHEQTEAAVGRYSADLVFREESTNRPVVVENMFGATDHDHLGKLITYAAGLEAGYAVLLAPELRDEHRSALTWLNSISTDDFGFFGIVLEAWRIGDSDPAPRLRVEVKPDDWSRSVQAARSSELTETQQAYQRFWGEFLPMFRDAYPALDPRSQAFEGFLDELPVHAVRAFEAQRNVLPACREVSTASGGVHRRRRRGCEQEHVRCVAREEAADRACGRRVPRLGATRRETRIEDLALLPDRDSYLQRAAMA